jgi:hypothetical protein
MILSNKAKSALAQFLGIFNTDTVYVLLTKHNFEFHGDGQIDTLQSIEESESENILQLLEEIARTYGDLRNQVNPRYRYDERFADLARNLSIEGIILKKDELKRIATPIDAAQVIEDELIDALTQSSIEEKEIIKHLELSHNAFTSSSPNFNSCLVHARIAIETLIVTAASNCGYSDTDPSKPHWGRALAHLHKNGTISKREEEALSSVYTLASQGAHKPIHFTEEEFARFGRNQVVTMCYYISKALTNS